MKRPFRRIITDSEAAWLEARKGYITASDVAALVGANPYKRREDVIAEKSGLGEERETTAAMYWGIKSEAVILSGFSEITGVRLRHRNWLLVRDDARVAATLDGLCFVGRGPRNPRGRAKSSFCVWPGDTLRDGMGLGVIDAKCVASRNRSLWNKPTPPEIYWWQIQAQLYVTGLDYGVLVAKVDAAEVYAHVIERDAGAAEEILNAAKSAWREING